MKWMFFLLVGTFVSFADIDVRNFKPVVPGKIYRSGMFKADDLEDMGNELGVRTILFLHDTNNQDYLSSGENDKVRKAGHIIKDGIKIIRVPLDGYRPDSMDFLKALEIVLDTSNHPVVFHCQGGKHRSGMLGMALRKGLKGKWLTPYVFYINNDLEIKLNEKDADFVAENLSEYEYFTFFTYGRWFEKPFLKGPRQENLDFIRNLDLSEYSKEFDLISE